MVCKGRKVKSLDIPCKGKGFDASSEYRIVTLIFSTRQPFSKVSFSNMNFVKATSPKIRTAFFYSGFPFPHFLLLGDLRPTLRNSRLVMFFLQFETFKESENCRNIGNRTSELCLRENVRY